MKQFYTYQENLFSYKLFIDFVVLLYCTTDLTAQPRSAMKKSQKLQFGSKVGVVYTPLTNLSNVLMSEPYYTGYTFGDKSQCGFTASVFLNYKFDQTILKKVI